MVLGFRLIKSVNIVRVRHTVKRTLNTMNPGGVRPTTAVHHGGNSNIASFRSRRGRVHNSWRRGEDSKQSDTVYLFGAYAVELRRA